jgi:hypothetical protein
MKAKNYHNENETFNVGQVITHCTDEGQLVEGRITEIDADAASLHIEFADGDEGWEKLETCYGNTPDTKDKPTVTIGSSGYDYVVLDADRNILASRKCSYNPAARAQIIKDAEQIGVIDWENSEIEKPEEA